VLARLGPELPANSLCCRVARIPAPCEASSSEGGEEVLDGIEPEPEVGVRWNTQRGCRTRSPRYRNSCIATRSTSACDGLRKTSISHYCCTSRRRVSECRRTSSPRTRRRDGMSQIIQLREALALPAPLWRCRLTAASPVTPEVSQSTALDGRRWATNQRVARFECGCQSGVHAGQSAGSIWPCGHDSTQSEVPWIGQFSSRIRSGPICGGQMQPCAIAAGLPGSERSSFIGIP
jgi:hypothetical protein